MSTKRIFLFGSAVGAAILGTTVLLRLVLGVSENVTRFVVLFAVITIVIPAFRLFGKRDRK